MSWAGKRNGKEETVNTEQREDASEGEEKEEENVKAMKA